jgi:4-amino-4-deoxy-L-arabinose transferase-like glycosyltransferase
MTPPLPAARWQRGLLAGLAVALTAIVFWLRGPTLGFNVWNVDEAIHAAVAREILHGGVLYRDAYDLRHPLSYYAFAGVFAVAGENNLWAVRVAIALLLVATALCLHLAARRLAGPGAGVAAALTFAVLSSSALYPGDAFAANVEWFVAFFSAAAAAVFLAGGAQPSPGRCAACGALLAGSFLSKQPALLEAGAPLAALTYLAWQGRETRRQFGARVLALAAGWLAPLALALVYFWLNDAARGAIFYSWTYVLTYFGPEVTTAERFGTLPNPLVLLAAGQLALVAAWLAGSVLVAWRLAQRQPASAEAPGNPGLLYLAVWSLASYAGALSSGRGFDHYVIPFLAPFCLGAGLATGWLGRIWRHGRGRAGRVAAALLLAVIAGQLVAAAGPARGRKLSRDSSVPVAEYIQAHSAPDDRIFVWGFHADIYLYADRRAASRHVYGAFVTGLIPWTNVAPERDTSYAAVPGAMDELLGDLARTRPLFIVDCSAGPNRYWQKYPLENFPPLHDYIRAHYRQAEPHVFLAQGYRLYRRLNPGEAPEAPEEATLPADVRAKFAISTLSAPLAPLRAAAHHGAARQFKDGRDEFFAHAPSSFTYRVPAGATALRGGFGINAGAYAADNTGPTDGADFTVRWRPASGPERVLFSRLLRPRETESDRNDQTFRVELPDRNGGELELVIGGGPADNFASDWTYWTDLMLETANRGARE